MPTVARSQHVRSIALLLAACAIGTSSLAGCASSGKFAAHKAAIERFRPCVQERLDAFRQRVGAPGATAAFVLPGGHGAAVASGISSKTSQQAMRPNDRMLAGSTGKTYVAAVLLQLLEEGRVDLDAKVANWLGEYEWFSHVPNAADITLRMLMNHTSGIPEHVATPELMAALKADPDKVWRPAELVAFILDKDPLFPAGEGWSYADTNYILVGMIIEQVTGRTYYQELTDRILKPLKLRDTSPSDRNPLRGLVSGYTGPNNPFPVPEEVATGGRHAFNPQMEWTGGGVLSTSLDLARWGRLLYAGDVLESGTRTLMLQGVPTGRWLNTDYGLGVIIRRTPQGVAYGHGGWFPGYLTNVSYYPDCELVVAVQLNSDQGASFDVLNGFLDELARAFVDEND